MYLGEATQIQVYLNRLYIAGMGVTDVPGNFGHNDLKI